MKVWTRETLFGSEPIAALLDGAVEIDRHLIELLRAEQWSERTRTGGLITDSISFGTTTRNLIRGDFCRPARTAGSETHRALESLAQDTTALYQRHFPDRYRRHPVPEREYRLGGGPWNAGTCNRTKQLPLHRDSGNLVGHWSAITWITEHGSGPLVVPELDLEIEPKTGDVFFFEGAELEHGVPHSTGERFSIVFYTRACACLPASEELERYRKLCTKREQRLRHGFYAGKKPELRKAVARQAARLPGL